MTKQKKSKIEQSPKTKPISLQGGDDLEISGPHIDEAQLNILWTLVKAISVDDEDVVKTSFLEFNATGAQICLFQFANYPISSRKPGFHILQWAQRARAYRSLLLMVDLILEFDVPGFEDHFAYIQASAEFLLKGSEAMLYAGEVVRKFAAKCAAQFQSEAMEFCFGGMTSVAIFKEEIAKVHAANEASAIAQHIASESDSTASLAAKHTGANRL